MFVRLLFINYGSEFHSTIPFEVIVKLQDLDLGTPLCSWKWILDILASRPQLVQIKHNISFSLAINTGEPQGCMFSPLLYSLSINDYVTKPSSSAI